MSRKTHATCRGCGQKQAISHNLFHGEEMPGYHCSECVKADVHPYIKYPEVWVLCARGEPPNDTQEVSSQPLARYNGPPVPKSTPKHPFAGKLMGGIVEMCPSSRSTNLLILWEYIESDDAPTMYSVDAEKLWSLFYENNQQRNDVPAMHFVRHAKLLEFVRGIIEGSNKTLPSLAAE